MLYIIHLRSYIPNDSGPMIDMDASDFSSLFILKYLISPHSNHIIEQFSTVSSNYVLGLALVWALNSFKVRLSKWNILLKYTSPRTKFRICERGMQLFRITINI